MRIFLDTNVVLDWILDRPNCFAEESSKIIGISEIKKFEVYISAGSVYTIAYILEKSGLKTEKLRGKLFEILSILKVVPINENPFLNACKNGMKDIEDAFQYEIACSVKSLDYFVTGNTKDFKGIVGNTFLILNPKEMLKFL